MNAPITRSLINVLLAIVFTLAVSAVGALLVSVVSWPPDPRDAAIAEFGADLDDLADTVRRLQAAQAQQKGAE